MDFGFYADRWQRQTVLVISPAVGRGPWSLLSWPLDADAGAGGFQADQSERRGGGGGGR